MWIIEKIKQNRLTVFILFLFTVTSALMLPVNPWPRDGWFRSQYKLIGSFPGADNYTPISAPAIFHKIINQIAKLFELDLKAEFYMGSITQNLFVFISALLVLWSCQKMGMRRIGSFVSILFIAFVLSTGLPQAVWSENIVLLLFSTVLYLTVMVYVGDVRQPKEFWLTSLACGAIIGLLVVTRIVPILLIPCLALLFFRRLNKKQFFSFLAVISTTTAVFVLAMLLSNYARFGRFELTNSSGRHLWQGVTPINDQVLADSSEYLALKQHNPELGGKNHWEIIIPGDQEDKYGGEAILGRLAKEAIFNKPLTYIKLGIWKFVHNIGKRPYRLGFGKELGYDPLNTDELLPPITITKLKIPSICGDIVYKAFDLIYWAFKWIYPFVLFIVLTTYCGYIIFKVHILSHFTDPTKVKFIMRYGALVFFIIGIPLIILASFGIKNIIFAGLCLVILVLQAILLYNSASNNNTVAITNAANIGLFFTFNILLYFGSLWFSWQIEIANTRNTLPYLPFIFITFGISLVFWRNLLRECRIFK